MQGVRVNSADMKKLAIKFHEILPELSKEEIEKFFSFLEERRYSSGTVLWKQGDPTGYMGLLVEGRLIVKREGRFQGKNIILASLEKGSLFGEMSIVASSKHSITLSALENSETYILSYDNAQRLFRDEPALAIKLLKRIIVVTALRLQYTGARLAEIL